MSVILPGIDFGRVKTRDRANSWFVGVSEKWLPVFPTEILLAEISAITRELWEYWAASLILHIEIAYGLDWSAPMDKPRPYLTAALLCESVLQEKNESLSVIHIADKLSYTVVGMPDGMRPAANISGLICLKSGPVTGAHTIRIVVENPKGKRQEVYSMPVNLQGKDHGQNIILNIGLGIEFDGLYWFDVVFDEDVLTRIPLVIAEQERQVPTTTELRQ